jgi:hypothetical protein
MQENQELINSLLEKQKTSAYSQQVAMDPEENQLLITRVVSAKYKVYVIILLILGVLIGTTYLPDAQRHYESVNARYEAKQAELTTLQQQVNEYTSYKAELKSIGHYNDAIMDCINTGNCENIPDLISGDLRSVVSFVQMGDLSSDKMGIDEQKILKNLDQYLIKNEPGTSSSSNNGKIQLIDMGEPEVIEGKVKFYKLPIEVEITFDDKDDLITFVDNIESYIIPDKENRILYVIEEVSYDIMAYDEEQSTNVSLSAYYFR